MSKHINKYRKPVSTTKSKSAVSVVELASYTSPVIVESTRNEWVGFGADNNYFQYLIDRYNGSATNNAAINGISQMIFGKGLDALDSSKKPEAYARMISLLKKDDIRRNAYDLKLTGQTAVMAYYYYPDWANIEQSDEPLRIPAFNSNKDGHAAIEILYVKPYRAGMYYYSTPDYQGGLQYAELEEEIGNYHINNVQNGLSPGLLINFNNGVPDEATQRLTENKIKSKYGGSSRSGTPIIAFNDNKESAATIDAVQLSDAHNQYQFLSDESQKKIMVAHRVISPMLMGIKDASGLGNNAEELKTATILMDNTVIRPFQDLLLDAYTQILAVNDISLKLYFKTLQPLEFTDLENVHDKETREEETGVKMSKAFKDLEEFGEDEDLKEWDLIDERKVNYDTETELDEEINDLNKPSLLSKIWNLATTGTARPNAKSSQDGEANGIKYKVRYQYAPLTASSDSRDFCKKMVTAKKIYRKEDIQQMSKNSVNKGWGLEGADNYDIFLYKGGGDCHHFWMRKTYRAKSKGLKPDVGNPNAEVSVNKAKKDGFTPEVNAKDVAKRPTDMPNNGFVNKKR
jgi:hypothetical protein